MPTPPPIDTRTLRRIGGQLGSNPGGQFEDAQGRRYYVKTAESPAHARNERLAAALYALAGAPTLTYVDTADPSEVATTWVRLDHRPLARWSEPLRRQAQRWLAVHAWTANWDATGALGDNQGIADGVVVTLDVGGALAFRAHGDPKGKAFGTRVDEIDALRHDPDNPHAMRLFGPMTAQAVADAVSVVTRLDDDAIRAAVLAHGGSPRLAEQMVARKHDLAARTVDAPGAPP